jgi:hypothetical protein
MWRLCWVRGLEFVSYTGNLAIRLQIDITDQTEVVNFHYLNNW